MNKKRGSINSIVLMVLSTIIFIIMESCTSDQFFGIEEETDGLNYSVLNKIALSKEYVEFQKQMYLSTEAIDNIDTTKKVIVNYCKGKPMYAYEEIVSFKGVFDAYQQLVELYPEYKSTNAKERKQILSLALFNNASLKMLLNKYHFATHGTKSCSPESMAYLYAQASDAERETDSKWRLGSFGYWYLDDYFPIIVNAALNISESGKECGGMVFFDDSGILNEDLNATPVSMNLYWDERISFQPIYDFHVHPNGNINCSGEDVLSWASLPWSTHYIVTKSGCERYDVVWPD